FQKRQAALLRAARSTTRSRRTARRRAVHPARGRAWLDVCAERSAGRADTDSLRTARITGAQRALFPRHESCGELVHAQRKPVRAAGRSSFSLRANYLSTDRASYRRGDVAFPEPSFRIAAGDVYRTFARARE